MHTHILKNTCLAAIKLFFKSNKIKIIIGFLLTLLIFNILFSGSEITKLKQEENLKVSSLSYTQTEEYKHIISIQESFVRVAKAIKPAVVNVSSLTQDNKYPSSFKLFKNKFSFKGLREYLEDFSKQKSYKVSNLGSGIIFSRKGYIITNYHVIENAERLLVKLSDNRKFEGVLIGADKKTDLAVIKIETFRSLPRAPLGDSNKLQIGQWVIAIGNPYGLERTVTTGVVSSTGRSGLGIATYEDFIQTDASINPGNSGGPLLDLEGKVVGINTAILGLGTGIGFAIPIEMVKLICEELIEKGKVNRGWIGAGIQPLTPELAKTFHSASQKGALVNQVIPDAPAFKGGLKQGDIIVTFDENSVTSSSELQRMVAFSKIGEIVKLKVLRNGEFKAVKIKILKMQS